MLLGFVTLGEGCQMLQKPGKKLLAWLQQGRKNDNYQSNMPWASNESERE